MSGAVPSSLEGEVQSTPRVRSGDTPRPDAAIAARCPVALFDAQGSEVKRYLNETRGLDDTTLAVYGVGYASRKFRDGERWVDEPCATFPWIQVPDDGPASTMRLKVRSVRTKRHMRVEPAGFFPASFFFGSRRRRPSFYVVASRTRTPPRRRRDVARFDGITGRSDVIAATSRLRRTSIAETLIVEGVAATLSPRDFTPSSRRRLLFTPSPRAFTSTPSPQDKTPSSTQAATGASSACTPCPTTRPSSLSRKASTTRWPSTRRRAARPCRCRTAPRRCRRRSCRCWSGSSASFCGATATRCRRGVRLLSSCGPVAWGGVGRRGPARPPDLVAGTTRPYLWPRRPRADR